MKITLKKLERILIISCLFINTGLMAQYEWAPIGAEWYYCVPDLTSGDPRFSYENYVVEKDTIIEGKVCKVIKSNSNTEYFYQDKYKVYYWFNEKFNLLYDFDVNIGDTIEFDFKSISVTNWLLDTIITVKCVIESINTTSLNDNNIHEYLSKILPNPEIDHLVWNSYYQYFEKYGNLYEFMEIVRPPSLDYEYKLRCYSDNDISFINPWWKQYNISCDYKVGINQSFIKYFNIYPNPCNDIVFIELFSQVNYNYFNISIFDINGQNIEEFNVNANIEYVDISNLRDGMYYIQLRNTKTNIKQIQKFIKK